MSRDISSGVCVSQTGRIEITQAWHICASERRPGVFKIEKVEGRE